MVSLSLEAKKPDLEDANEISSIFTSYSRFLSTR